MKMVKLMYVYWPFGDIKIKIRVKIFSSSSYSSQSFYHSSPSDYRSTQNKILFVSSVTSRITSDLDVGWNDFPIQPFTLLNFVTYSCKQSFFVGPSFIQTVLVYKNFKVTTRRV